MRGVISAIARDGSYGQIASEDGQRYSYWTTQVRNGPVQVGDPVNFQMQDGQPADIFNLAAALAADPPAPGGGSRAMAPANRGRSASSAVPQRGAGLADQAKAWSAQFDAQAAQAGLPGSNYWITLFTSLNGRISRRQFWLHGVLPLIGAAIVLRIIAYTFIMFAPSIFLLVSFAVFLVLLWPQLCISYKRFQDVGYPGWYNYFWLVPLLGAQALTVLGLFSYGLLYLFGTIAVVLSSIAGLVILAALILVYIRVGQEGPNQYGPDPLAAA